MKSLFHPSAVIKATSGTGADDTTITSTIVADADEFWVLRKLWISHDASGATDFDNLNSLVLVTVKFASTIKWQVWLHPGNGGTGSVEFEAGPWEFDFGPGLYVGTKNEALVIGVGAFGTGIAGNVSYLYQ